mmetsp:Transcript_63344/g.100660  ORF Transcript_63344/g.100660 Transcript_63344/m.100660 type:complete len:341 (+) Transcript_63344:1248-2270(+)
MDKGGIIEVWRIQSRWTLGRLDGPRHGPALQGHEGHGGIFQALLQLAGLEMGQAAIGHDHGALLLRSVIRLAVELQGLLHRLLVSLSQALIGLIFHLQRTVGALHALQILSDLFDFLRIQALRAERFFEVCFGLLKGSEPKERHAHANFHTCPHLFIFRIRAVVKLTVARFVPEIQDLNGSVAVLQTLLEVAQVERGQGPVGEATRVGGQLQGLCVGVVGTSVVTAYHELISLVFQPNRVVLILLSFIPSQHWRKLRLRSFLGKWCRFASAITYRDSWSWPLSEAQTNLPRIVADVGDILFCVRQVLLAPDGLLWLHYLRLRSFFHLLVQWRLDLAGNHI